MTERIRDPSDPRVDDYRGLRDARARRRIEEEGGFFIAEGATVVRRLLAGDHLTRSVLVSDTGYRKLGGVLDALDIPVYLADREVMQEIAGFDVHRGVLAAGDRRPLRAVDSLLGSLAVLEGINDHENLGALFRAAAALGMDGVVLDPASADPYYRRSVRVSMGAVLTVPFARARRWPSELETIGRDRTIIAMTVAPDAVPIGEIEVDGPVAIVVGAEGPGLDPRTVAACDLEVTVPMTGRVDSLNVGHAAAIAFHLLGRP